MTRHLALGVALLAVLPAARIAPQVPVVAHGVWAKPDHFWFRKTVAGGHLYLTVDAEHGVKEPLFDHQRLAIELNLRTGADYTPLTLPFADPAARFVVKYDGSNAYIQEGAMAIEFVLDDSYWRCDLQIKWDWNKVPPTDYECKSAGRAGPAGNAGQPGDTGRRVSPDGRWSATVENHNIVITPLRAGDTARTLTTDGTAAFAYQPGSIRWSADSSSLSVYRVNESVWTSESVTGNVKQHVTKKSFTLEKSFSPRLQGKSSFHLILSVISVILPACVLLNAATSATSLSKSIFAAAISR